MAANLRDILLDNGVKNLKTFGYPDVTKETILTDAVYSAFFESMLKENIGVRGDIDKVINQLLSELKKP